MKTATETKPTPHCGGSRQNHLAWCKLRALKYADRGDDTNAMASMMSDLGKHPETKGHIGIELGMMLAVGGMLKGYEMRKWIEGFN